jgi:Flp pilus assembly protein protease CpaA
MGGMGAGDVKASMALGAWLGLWRAFALFVYMGLAGGLIILVVLLWQRRFLSGIREVGNFLLNWVLCRHFDAKPPPAGPSQRTNIPYGAAMALGMAVLCWRLA